MKKFLLYILSIPVVFTGILIPVHQAEAFAFVPFLIYSGATGLAAWLFGDKILGAAVSVVLWFLDLIRTLAATLVTVAQQLLNFVVDKTVINSDLGSINAINIGWEAARDLVNMFFIFVLLYIAIATILNLGQYKKTLVTLVVIALTVNFSLFATKVVIDASNVIAVGLYNEMGLGKAQIGDRIAGGLEVQKLYKLKPGTNTKNKVNEAQTLFLSIIFLLVTAWVLLNAAFLLVGRFVAFIFLLILSPIAFVSFILPGLKSKIFDKWWNTLVSQAIVAPVFFFLFFIVIKIIEQNPFSYTAAQDPHGVSILFNFVVLVGLMWAALKVTRDVSGSIGASATSWGKKATGLLAGGAVGLAGRRVVGRAASRLAATEGMKDWAAKSRTGATALKGVRGVAGSSFDVRAITPSAAGLGRATGRGGYEAQLKKQTTKRAQFAKSLGVDTKAISEQEGVISGAKKELEDKKIELERAQKFAGSGAATVQREAAAKVKELEEKITAAEKRKTELKTERQEGYAKTLETKPLERAGLWTPRKDKEGAMAIRKELSKNKTQKLEEVIKEISEESAKKSNEGEKSA